MAHVELKAITKSFGAVEVLPSLDLSIEQGEFVVLVGPSGCGKTTTLRILAGLETESSGEIRIAGKDVTGVRPGLRDCAMVFQNYALYPHMTVRENIGYAMRVHGVDKQIVNERVSDAACLLGLESFLDRKPRSLSGGQRQRVAIGRALVREPQVFLFDEPLSNLDAKLRVEMRTEIKLLQRRLGTTTVYVTHDQVEAMTMADRVVVMNEGRIEQAADPIELYEFPANLFVANFIGSPAMNFLPASIFDGILRIGDQALAITDEDAKRFNGTKDVVFGMRPEHMRPSECQSMLSIVLDTLEPLGSHTLLLGHTGDTKITAQMDPRFPAKIGESCEVPVDMTQAHFFDRETGRRL